MRDSTPSLGTPPRLFAEEMLLRAVLDVLERLHPAAKQLVFDRAHERLSQAGPTVSHEHGFFHDAHSAIDAIMQVPTAEAISAQRAEKARRQEALDLVSSAETPQFSIEAGRQSAA